MKEWEQYEKQIFEKYESKFTDCSISKNVKIMGKYSNVPRQVDVLLKGTVADRAIEVVLECKYFNKKVDVKTVDSFIGFLEDIGVQYGTIITNNGFSDGAKNRAKNSTTRNIKLDVVDFRDFDDYEFEPDVSICEVCDYKYGNFIFWEGRYPEEDFELAYCESCNEPHMRCSYCGEVTPLIFDANKNGVTKCRGECGLEVIYEDYDGINIKIVSKSKK